VNEAPRRVTSRTAQDRTKDHSLARGKARWSRGGVTVKVQGRPVETITEDDRIRVRIGGVAQCALLLDDAGERTKYELDFISSQVCLAPRESLLTIAGLARGMLDDSWDNSSAERNALRGLVRNIEKATGGNDSEQPKRNRDRSNENRTEAQEEARSGSEAVRVTARNVAPNDLAFGGWRQPATRLDDEGNEGS